MSASDVPSAQVPAQGSSSPTQTGGRPPGAGQGPLLRGVVLEPDRTPVPRAVLTLVDQEGRQAARTASGVDGRWTLTAPRAAPYVLIVGAHGHQPQAVPVVAADRTAELDVVLGGTGRLRGTVRSAEGVPVDGATVVLTDAHGEVAAATRSDAEGRFHLRDLVCGRYTLAVNGRAFRPAALAVEVAATGETVQDVVLTGSGTLRGTVRTEGGHPVPDARVTLLESTGGVVAATVTGADGRFRFTDLEPGEYTVIASGYAPVATALRIEDGDTEHDLHLSHREAD